MTILPVDAPILIFIGPSGVGKSTIVRRLTDSNLIELTPTWTDRPPRTGEVEQEHILVSSKELDAKAATGYFAHEPLQLFGLPFRYACPKITRPALGKVPVIMARVMTMKLIDSLYPNRIIYQIEAPQKLVESRLQIRQTSGQDLGTRLSNIIEETKAGRKVANRIFNNNGTLEATVTAITAAIHQDFDTLYLT